MLTSRSPPVLCQPLVGLAIALVNGSHGMTFAPKIAMIGSLILVDLSFLAICGIEELTIHSQAGLRVGLGWGLGSGSGSGSALRARARVKGER